MTLGKPTLEASNDKLQIAASLAAHSRHPYSQAISQAYEGELISLGTVEEIPGKGVQAFHEGKNIRLGKIDWCEGKTQASDAPKIWLAVEGEEAVCFSFHDAL